MYCKYLNERYINATFWIMNKPHTAALKIFSFSYRLMLSFQRIHLSSEIKIKAHKYHQNLKSGMKDWCLCTHEYRYFVMETSVRRR